MSKDNAIQVFNHPQFGSINTVETENGKVLFRANDVAKALGYVETAQSGTHPLQGGCPFWTPPYENQLGTIVMQPTKYISEADVLPIGDAQQIARSGEVFRTGYASEVLPSIRKHGGLSDRCRLATV